MRKVWILLLLSLASTSVLADAHYQLARAIVVYADGTKIDTQEAGNGWSASGTMVVGAERITQSIEVCADATTDCITVNVGATIISADPNLSSVQVSNDSGVFSEFIIISVAPYISTLFVGDGFTEVDQWQLVGTTPTASLRGKSADGAINSDIEMGRAVSTLGRQLMDQDRR